MHVSTRKIADLAPVQRFRYPSASTFNTVSTRHMKGRPEDVFIGHSPVGLDRDTAAAGVDPSLMGALGFRAKPNPGGKWGTVWIWVTGQYEDDVLTNQGMRELAAQMTGARVRGSGKRRHSRAAGKRHRPRTEGGKRRHSGKSLAALVREINSIVR